MVERNYLQIKQYIEEITSAEMERMLNNPGLKHLIIQKGAFLYQERDLN